MLSPGVLLRRRANAIFTPASLFNSGEAGAWYKIDDSHTFLSTTDLTPCDETDSCGFLLDKSQGAGYSGGVFTGAGDELLSGDSRNFTSSLGDWSYYTGAGSASSVGGKYEASGGISRYRLTGLIEQGALYYVEYDFTKSDPTLVLGIGDRSFAETQVPAPEASSGTASGYFVATIDQAGIYASTGGGGTVTVDNLVYKKIPGNHATQGTAASRPTLEKTAGGLWYLDFDGVDDFLEIPLAVTDSVVDLDVFAAFETTDVTSTQGVLGYIKSASDFFYAPLVESSDVIFRIGLGDNTTTKQESAISNDTAYVVTTLIQADTPQMIARANGAEIGTSTDLGANGALNGTYNVFMGARNNLGSGDIFLGGRIYGAILRQQTSTADEISEAESYMADRSGVTL